MTTRAANDISLLTREARELETFTRAVRDGRSRAADAELVLSRRDVRRLLDAREGTSETLEQMLVWTRPLPGARVLEICCHDAEFGAILAFGGADVTCVDLCPDLIAQARRRIALNGLEGRMTAQVMSVHALDFPDGHFDFVFGKESLHHLDLEDAKREIFRVMKPGGYGVFSEPVSFSRTLRAVRSVVPVPVDKDSPDERQLDERDLDRFTQGFVQVERAYFRLASRLDRILPLLHRPLAHLDRALLDRFPALGAFAGNCVLRVRKPLAAACAAAGMEPWG
jgi:SAM-dependent methyltransferase